MICEECGDDEVAEGQRYCLECLTEGQLMRNIRVNITFSTDAVHDKDVERIVWNAVAQLEDPAGEDGEHADFDTANVKHDILFNVP